MQRDKEASQSELRVPSTELRRFARYPVLGTCAIIAPRKARFGSLRLLRAVSKRFARLAQIHRCAKNTCSG